MATEQQGWLDWLFGRGPKPKGPTPPKPSEMAGGHRGIAMGSREDPDRSAENIAQWQQTTGDEVERFVLRGEVFPVHSSNVEWFRYVIKQQVLYVGFKGGSEYIYYNVTPQEAIQAAKYQSKGSFVWDYLRKRGSRRYHKKPYRRIR